MRIVKELIGKEVLGTDITVMGKVVDVDIDDDEGTVESIIVSKGGIQETLNIKKSELVIPFDTISKIGDKVILKDVFDDDFSQIEEEIEDLKSQL
ncbi:MAG: PRC-barrel domain-containing protein [Methanobrevibacter sp.]|nr:PRC-barrel domain-containing protein [Methanobrevibacter sp.]